MKTTPWIKLCKGAALALAVSYGLTYCHTTKSKLTLEQKGDSLTVIHITYPANYILLPIEEEAMESQVLLDTGEATDTDMDIRLAQTKVDYFVPLALPAGAKTATVRVRNKSKDALCWKEIKLSDTFDTANTDKFRPVYHHTPLYGWMNDANGLVYKDGEYHLYNTTLTVPNGEICIGDIPSAEILCIGNTCLRLLPVIHWDISFPAVLLLIRRMWLAMERGVFWLFILLPVTKTGRYNVLLLARITGGHLLNMRRTPFCVLLTV